MVFKEEPVVKLEDNNIKVHVHQIQDKYLKI